MEIENITDETAVELAEANRRIELLEEECKLLRKKIKLKDSEIVWLNGRSEDVIRFIREFSENGIMRLWHFWARISSQLIHGSREDRHDFWKWLSDHRHHIPNTDRRFNPVFEAERIAKMTNKALEKEKEELLRECVFDRDICISILVPLYNTPEKFLREMIESVQAQTYSNWELCLADGSDAEHDYVGKVCAEYADADGRVHYKKLEKNLGISENTNACIDMAGGDYIALFDHDDMLHPAALYYVMQEISMENADFIYTDEATFHDTPDDAFFVHNKPDYFPDTFRTNNYICHLSVFSRALLRKAGRFRKEFDGSQDYDFILRLTENAKKVVHIPKVLYYWRAHANSVAGDLSAKPYCLEAAKAALREHLERVGLDGTVEDAMCASMYRIRYRIKDNPKVSIVIPNMDHADTLRRCVSSIFEHSTYDNYEIVIIENNSKEKETFAYYDELKKDSRVKIVTWDGIFNYSAINNFGVREAADGEYILLLNNDTSVITPDWIEQMLMFAQRQDVGAVGAMLYYPNDTIQHAGVILGVGGVANHIFNRYPRNSPGYMGRASIIQNLTAVTAACCMIRRDVWDEIGGLDEEYGVAFNDVDMCMRIRKAGYLIVWTPYAELYHYESESRGNDDTPEKRKRFEGEVKLFQSRWSAELAAGDPSYNPNLFARREGFDKLYLSRLEN